MTRGNKSSDLLAQCPRELWALTIVFFRSGDLITTGIGFASGGIVETGSLGAPIMSKHGIPGMVMSKISVLSLAYTAWKFIPNPQRIGIPLGLAIVGVLATGWNVLVLVSVLR